MVVHYTLYKSHNCREVIWRIKRIANTRTWTYRTKINNFPVLIMIRMTSYGAKNITHWSSNENMELMTELYKALPRSTLTGRYNIK